MNDSLRHPSLYEINTRILLSSFGPEATLSDIPGGYWKDLRDNGIDWVWLMGIWEIQEKALDPHLIPKSMLDDFHLLMHDLTDDDVCGSPYAIHDYVIDPDIGTVKELKALRKTLHKLGMKLLLDFVPNHFGAHTKWLSEHPEYFIEVDEFKYIGDQKTCYRPWHDKNVFFAHGKDPYFDAWQDTVQVNYLNPATQQWMTSILQSIAGLCDGVRCDMAMLAVDRIFRKTWTGWVQLPEHHHEFWPAAIKAVRTTHPAFCFLAECYWDMEAELLKMGFDFCYDKVFYDRIVTLDPESMRLHFHAEPWWLLQTARFLENHDEQRAATRLHIEPHLAAAALVAFGPGMRFWHHGQWEGWRKKIPVQIRRSPLEPVGNLQVTNSGEGAMAMQADELLHVSYEALLRVNQHDIFRSGEWRVLHELNTSPGTICWLWTLSTTRALVVINFSNDEIKFSLADQLHLLHFSDPVDLFSGKPVDPHRIHAIVPWGICVWRVNPVSGK